MESASLKSPSLRRPRPLLGALIVVEGMLLLAMSAMLLTAAITRRDSASVSISAKLVTKTLFLADQNPPTTPRDVLTLVQSTYQTYMSSVLDANGFIKFNAGSFDPRNNFSAFGAFNILSPMRLRQIRLKPSSGTCAERPAKFDLVPCVPPFSSHDADASIYRGPIHRISGFNFGTNTGSLQFPYLEAVSGNMVPYYVVEFGSLAVCNLYTKKGTVSGKLADPRTTLPTRYPSEGHIFLPDLALSVTTAIDRVATRALQVNNTYLPSITSSNFSLYLEAYLTALTVTSDDFAAATAVGLGDVLYGLEGALQSAPNEYSFMSDKTRVLFVEFALLNSNLESPVIVPVMLSFEFAAHGGVTSGIKVQPFRTDFGTTSVEIAVIVLVCLCFIVYVAQICVTRLYVVTRRGSAVASVAWELASLKALVLLGLIAVYAVCIVQCQSIQTDIDTFLQRFIDWRERRGVEATTIFPPFSEFGLLSQEVDEVFVLVTVAVCLLLVIVCQFLGKFKIFGRYLRLVETGAPLIGSFTVLFLIAVIFLAVCFHMQLAPRIDGFEAFGVSILAVFRMLVGDFWFDIFSTVGIADEPALTYVLYVMFTILYVWVGLNVFIAIVSRAHEEALQVDDSDDVTCASEAIFDLWQHCSAWALSLSCCSNNQEAERQPSNDENGHREPPTGSWFKEEVISPQANPVLMNWGATGQVNGQQLQSKRETDSSTEVAELKATMNEIMMKMETLLMEIRDKK